MKNYRIHVEEMLNPLLEHGCKVISITGSGGKTTFIRKAAMHYAKQYHVGVAASTKMCLPDGQWVYQNHLPDVVSSDRQNDREKQTMPICFYTAHILPEGKIWGVDRQIMDRAMSECGLLLIEADGSKRKPLKGWRQDEPVILPESEATIGILPMHCLRHPINETNVHRIERFTNLTDLKAGDLMTEAAYLRMVTAENGLFGHSHGSKWLVLNRAHNGELYQSARNIAEKAMAMRVIDGWIAGCLEDD